jgi:hypothetical protein
MSARHPRRCVLAARPLLRWTRQGWLQVYVFICPCVIMPICLLICPCVLMPTCVLICPCILLWHQTSPWPCHDRAGSPTKRRKSARHKSSKVHTIVSSFRVSGLGFRQAQILKSTPYRGLFSVHAGALTFPEFLIDARMRPGIFDILPPTPLPEMRTCGVLQLQAQ